MSTKDSVLVTGASGYIASWVVKRLLEKGYTVHGTVRDISRSEKVSHLEELGAQFPGKLNLFEADLLKKGSFKEAMQGCSLVMHTASPFLVQGIKNAEQQLVEPALQGTREVLETANATPSVKRVVLTSSVAAIFCDNNDKNGKPLTEADWNTDSSLTYQPYPYSKTVAEREAWTIAEGQDQWDLVVINPSFVQGPTLSNRQDSTSMGFVLNMVNGQFKTGAPGMYFGIVDVRDLADAHVNAGELAAAKGRHILSAEEKSVYEMAEIIRSGFDKKLPLPTAKLPKWLMYLFGPLNGFNWRYVRNNIDVPITFDNTKSEQELGVSYRPVEETLIDLVRDFDKRGWIKN